MNTEALLYFVAAGLFAAAAGIGVGSNRTIDLGSVLLLAAAVAFAWLGARKRGPQS
jgi:hypothetical protein